MTQPSNFSWLLEGLLAGSGYPSSQDHFQFYKQQGIKYVVNLTEHKISPDIVPQGMDIVRMPIMDFTPPSIQQISDFIRLVDEAKSNNERVVCHCQWGRGRTGTMLASYLVKSGMSPDDAIGEVRRKRPFSIETTEQEKAVFDFCNHLKQSQCK